MGGDGPAPAGGRKPQGTKGSGRFAGRFAIVLAIVVGVLVYMSLHFFHQDELFEDTKAHGIATSATITKVDVEAHHNTSGRNRSVHYTTKITLRLEPPVKGRSTAHIMLSGMKTGKHPEGSTAPVLVNRDDPSFVIFADAESSAGIMWIVMAGLAGVAGIGAIACGVVWVRRRRTAS